MMHTFVSKVYVEGKLIQTRYEVLRFDFECSACWCFTCRAVSKKYGKWDGEIITLEDQPEVQWTFAKKRYETDRTTRRENMILCQPPPFYKPLKDAAVRAGKWKGYDDEAPPYDPAWRD